MRLDRSSGYLMLRSIPCILDEIYTFKFIDKKTSQE